MSRADYIKRESQRRVLPKECRKW